MPPITAAAPDVVSLLNHSTYHFTFDAVIDLVFSIYVLAKIIGRGLLPALWTSHYLTTWLYKLFNLFYNLVHWTRVIFLFHQHQVDPLYNIVD